MSTLKIIICLSFDLCLASCADDKPTSLSLTGTIKGTVISENTKKPLSGVKVVNERTNASITTDSEGNFSFSGVTSGSYILKIDHNGYYSKWFPVIVNSNSDASASIELFPVVSGNNIPTVTDLVSPDFSDSTKPVYQSIQWKGNDPDNDKLQFTLLIGQDILPSTSAFKDSYSSSYSISLNGRGKTYYWRVIATDTKGASSISDIQYFYVDNQ